MPHVSITPAELMVVPAWEQTDPNSPSRRASAARRAGVEVQRDRLRAERAAVEQLTRRLRTLKRELQGVLSAAASTQFRRFTARTLIADIDEIVRDAQSGISSPLSSVFRRARSLGASAVDEAVLAARVVVTSIPRLDPELVTASFELTADLLSEPMQQLRNRVVQGVRSAAVAGEAGFEQIRQLAANIGDVGLDAAEFRAERIVRTELSRVFNATTFERMSELSTSLPFLRKAWRHTRDSRTRLGHRQAGATYTRGRGIPIRDRFRVPVFRESASRPPVSLGTARLRFPVDPQAEPAGRIAAASTILCRCNAFVDFDLGELQAFSTSRSVGFAVPGVPRGGVGV